MRLLLDTHVAIWAVSETRRLGQGIKAVIDSSENFVSLVSLWEIAIKVRSGRSDAPPFAVEEATLLFEQAGFELLDLRMTHLTQVQELPLHHRDPFDRLLLAQAMTEPMHLVTHDARLADYTDLVITC